MVWFFIILCNPPSYTIGCDEIRCSLPNIFCLKGFLSSIQKLMCCIFVLPKKIGMLPGIVDFTVCM